MNQTMSNPDLDVKPAAGAASSPPLAASLGSLGWTFLVSALLAVSLTLLSVVVFARASARKPAAPVPILSYDPAAGVSSMRREAVVQFESSGAPLTCTGMSTRSPAGRVVCPQDYGAVGGGCEGADPGDLLVTWGGTGWVCPKRESGRTGAVSASVLCCKYRRR